MYAGTELRARSTLSPPRVVGPASSPDEPRAGAVARHAERRWWLALAAIVVAGALLRVVWIGREALWGDEIFSRDVALQTFGEALRRVRADVVHPPFYYLLLDLTRRVTGTAPGALRAPSIVFGIGTIAALALALRRVLSRRDVPLVAAALLATSELQIYYSQEVRSYALYELLTLLAIWAVIEAVDRRTDPRRWVTFGVLAGAVVLTHNVGALFIAATVVAPVAAATRRTWRVLLSRWLVAVAPAAVLSIAWTIYVLPAMRARRGLGGNLAWIEHPGALDWATLYARFLGLPPLPHATSLAAALSTGLVGVAVYTAVRTRPAVGEDGDAPDHPPTTAECRRRVAVYTLLACAVGPTAALLALSNSKLGVSFWGERHLLPAAPCWIALIAVGVCTLATRSRVAGVLAAVAVFAPAVAVARDIPRVPLRVPYDRLAALLARPENRGVAAFTTAAWNVAAPTNLYLVDRDTMTTLPRAIDPSLPPTFFLAYRSFVPEEVRSVKRVQASGWRTVDSTRFVHGPSLAEGVILIRLVRPSSRTSPR